MTEGPEESPDGDGLGMRFDGAAGVQVGSGNVQYNYFSDAGSSGPGGPSGAPASRPAVPDRGGHAFICYALEDKKAVDRLQRAFQDAGIAVWRDTRDLWPGEDRRVKIRKAIAEDALAFIACFSSRSTAREQGYQYEELLLAIDQLRQRRPGGSWLFPVRFDNCDLPPFDLGADRTLTSYQQADLFGAGRDLATQRLVTAVQNLLLDKISGADKALPPKAGPGPDAQALQPEAAEPRAESPALEQGQEPVPAPAVAAVEVDLGVTRARELLGSAQWLASGLTDPTSKAVALASIAPVLARLDRSAATSLLDQAESSFLRQETFETALLIASSMAKLDPDAAIAFTNRALDMLNAAAAQCNIAAEISWHDPDRAVGLLTSTEGVLELGGTPFRMRRVKHSLSVGWATLDTEHACHVARSITEKVTQVRVLAEIAERVTAGGGEASAIMREAAAVAGRIRDPGDRALAQAWIAVAYSSAGNCSKADATVSAAEKILDSYFGVSNLLEAKRSIYEFFNPWPYDAEGRRNEILGHLARAAVHHPERAVRLALRASGHARQAALAGVGAKLAATSPERAESLAQSITDLGLRAAVMASAAEAVLEGWKAPG